MTNNEETVIAPLKAGRHAAASRTGPVIETERLILRQWRAVDIAPNTAMLSDPAHRALHHSRRQACDEQMAGWRNAAVMAGHWVLHGFGMFVVEEKSSGKFVGRVGPWWPPGWPGFEVGWGIANGISRQGLCGGSGAGRRSTGSFATFEIDGIIHCIDRENAASQA